MGAVEVGQTFEHHDWRQGIRELKQEADEIYGHQEGYSGAINSMDSFRVHVPSVKFKNMDAVWDYVTKRMGNLSKGNGEIIDLGVVEYAIAEGVIRDYFGRLPYTSLKGVTSPAILIDEYGNIKARGKVSEMKEHGRRLVLREKFVKDYYIVGKNLANPLLVTGEATMVKSTTRKSNDRYLILPYHKFVVYGWASS